MTEISKRGEGYEVTYISDAGDMERESFDAVVIAAPLEFADIQFNDIELEEIAKTKRPYQEQYVTSTLDIESLILEVVTGTLNPHYFGITEDEVPDAVLTIENSSLPFTSIGCKGVAKSNPKLKVYKVFSRKDVSEELLDSVFLNRTSTYRHFWAGTYPKLFPIKGSKFPFEISKNLYL